MNRYNHQAGSQIHTLLVVDDNYYHRVWLKVEFTDMGYRVITAGNGQEALSQVQTVRSDLVVLDLMQPGMNGLDVLRRMHDVDPHLPVIIHTTYAAHENHPAAQRAAAYLVKSSDTGLLKRTIMTVLHGGAGPSSASSRPLKEGEIIGPSQSPMRYDNVGNPSA